MNDILSDIHGRVGERVRAELVRNGASDALRDPAIPETRYLKSLVCRIVQE